jgi:hypothetical protein
MSTATVKPLGIFRSVDGAYTEVSKRRGLVRAIVSDDSNDRYNTAFLPHGADWSGYMKAGGPVLFDHGIGTRGTLPVGNAEAIERSKFKGRDCLVQDTRFWDSDEFAKTIKDAYESKRMRGWSIRCLPTSQSPPTASEIRNRPDWAKTSLVYRTYELAEVSATAIPGNANCLTQDILRSAVGVLALGGTIPGVRAACLGQRWYGMGRQRSRSDGRAHGTRVLVGLTS